jgi:hypothetical protein
MIGVGNRHKTFFWTNRCLHGFSVAKLLLPLVNSRAKNKRTVAAGMEDNKWLQDIYRSLDLGGSLTAGFRSKQQQFRGTCMATTSSTAHAYPQV